MYEKQLAWMPIGMVGVYLKIAFRFLQFVLGITIFGIYCADLVAAMSKQANPHPAWLFATTVGGLNAVTAVLYLLPCFHSYLFFWWDWVLVVLHAALIGVFGRAYITHKKHTDNPKDFKIYGPDFARQRSVAYIDVISGILWLSTAVMSTVIFLKIRRAKKAGEY
jgi:hypothetical protein